MRRNQNWKITMSELTPVLSAALEELTSDVFKRKARVENLGTNHENLCSVTGQENFIQA